MDRQKTIILPEPTLRRLPWYLAYLETIAARGVAHVSTTTISKALNVDASQIAKDISFLNIKGKTRIGYEVDVLKTRLSDFLDFKVEHRAYVLGAGSLGHALMHDTGLVKYGLNIVAAFDINPDLIDTEVRGVKVYPLAALKDMMQSMPAEIAIIAVPAESAQDVADAAIEAGIAAIWNFTPYRVLASDDVVVSNTSIYAHLALIYNRLNAEPKGLKQ